MNGRERPTRAAIPACHDDVCVTCSDEAVEVRVAHLLDDGLAVVDTPRGQEEVSIALVAAAAGDTILVHAKEAIAVITASAAAKPPLADPRA